MQNTISFNPYARLEYRLRKLLTDFSLRLTSLNISATSDGLLMTVCFDDLYNMLSPDKVKMDFTFRNASPESIREPETLDEVIGFISTEMTDHIAIRNEEIKRRNPPTK